MSTPVTPNAHLVPASGGVRASLIEAILAGFGGYKRLGIRILAEHGIAVPHAAEWVPLPQALLAHWRMFEQCGASLLVQVGLQVPNHFPMPPGPMDGHAALRFVDSAYQDCHYGGDVGAYSYEPLALRSGRLTCMTPYCCALEEGLITGFCRRVEPLAVVRHEPELCKSRGDAHCVFFVQW